MESISILLESDISATTTCKAKIASLYNWCYFLTLPPKCNMWS